MFDENKYPTMKLRRCTRCGNVYAMSLSGAASCPDCSSSDSSQFTPGENDNQDPDSPN